MTSFFHQLLDLCSESRPDQIACGRGLSFDNQGLFSSEVGQHCVDIVREDWKKAEVYCI